MPNSSPQSPPKTLSTLHAWQKAMDFAVIICKDVVCQLPKEEQFALADQLRRAAQSIPANIAEGFGRYHYQEAMHYCYIARGSLIEVTSHLAFARRMDYLSEETHQALVCQMDELHRTLNGYIAFLKRSKQGSSEPNHEIQDAPDLYSPEDLHDPNP